MPTTKMTPEDQPGLALFRQNPFLFLSLLAACTVGMILLGIGWGAVPISPLEIAALIFGKMGLNLPIEYSDQQEAALFVIRLPRVLMGFVVGAGLAVSGAVLQGLFRNPLVDPGLIGVSSGAAVAVALLIVSGLSGAGISVLPLAAFVGGLLTTLGIYRFARRGGRTEVTTLLLAGIAVNAVLGAMISFLIYLADDPQLRDIVFWMMGSLGSSIWRYVLFTAPLVIIALVLLVRLAPALNIMTLGEHEARNLGINTERLRLAGIALTALATGATVAVAGIIGFVGLVVPHMLRLLIGPDHVVLLPASVLGGALLVIGADIVARIVVSPAELPLGIVTAFLGGPFFLYLIERSRRQQGGWM